MTMSTEYTQPIDASAPVSGLPRIKGMNHVLLVCRDMKVTANFYVNILGFKLKMTGRQRVHDYGERSTQPPVPGVPKIERLYMFEASDGLMIGYAEVPQSEPATHTMFQPNFWPGAWRPPKQPGKVDHIAFNVDTIEELHWFRERLVSHGIAVSEVEARTRSLKSIYFYDPDEIPLEIATWDRSSPEWEDFDPNEYLKDPDPAIR